MERIGMEDVRTKRIKMERMRMGRIFDGLGLDG